VRRVTPPSATSIFVEIFQSEVDINSKYIDIAKELGITTVKIVP
jgi:hypothetical protein